MSLDNFAVFITTHGRPDRVVTYKNLRRSGYTGPIYLIVDNEDETVDRYRELYQDQVIVFDKLKTSYTVDAGDNFPNRKAVVYARNECFDVADNLGIEWFVQMDDDYNKFQYMFDSSRKFKHITIKNLDDVFRVYLEYFKSIDAHCIAFGQGGDYIGGGMGTLTETIKTRRKVMNVFFLSTQRRFDFVGRMNDDVNAYLTHGNCGKLMFTILQVGINQDETQSASGGMTDVYLESGTYQKTFYSVMYRPSCVKVYVVGTTHRRIHHHTNWNNAVPCILDEKYRKSGTLQGVLPK